MIIMNKINKIKLSQNSKGIYIQRSNNQTQEDINLDYPLDLKKELLNCHQF